MKKYIILFTGLLLFLLGCGVVETSKSFRQLTVEQQLKLSPDSLILEEFYSSYHNLREHKIYNTNAKLTREIITNSEKEFSLLVFYAYWCQPCRQQMPLIKEFHSKYKDKISLLYISTNEWSLLDKDREYLNSSDLTVGASLVVDINEYGDQYSPRKRFYAYYNALGISDYDSHLGFPTYILVKKDLKHLHTSVGEFNKEDIANFIE